MHILTRRYVVIKALLLLLVAGIVFFGISSMAQDSVYPKSINEKWIVNAGYSVLRITWSPDSAYLAAVKENGDMIILDTSGNILWEESDPNLWAYEAVWSPASDILAVRYDYYVDIVDANGNLLWRSVNLTTDYWYSGGVEWSPDGSKIAMFQEYGNVFVYSSTGDLLWDTTGISGLEVFRISWSPSGDRLAAATNFVKVLLFDADGNLLATLAPVGEDESLWGLLWSNDGSKLALVYSYKVFVYDRDGNLLWSYDANPNYISGYAWNPQGDQLAIGYSSGTILVFNGQGQVEATYNTVDNANGIDKIVWSPIGSYLAVALRGGSYFDASTIILIDHSQQEIVSKFTLRDACSDLEYHDSGELLAAGDYSGTVYIFDKYLNLVYVYERYDTPVLDTSWSPNGQYLSVGGGFSKVILFETTQESPLIGTGNGLQVSNNTASVILETNISYRGVYGSINGQWFNGYEITAYYTVREINGNLPILRVVFSFSPDIISGPVNFILYNNGEELDSNTVAFNILHPQEGVTYYVKFLVLTDADQATLQQNMQITYQLAPGENATVETVSTPPPGTTTQEQTGTSTASQEQTTTASNNLGTTTEEQSQQTTTPAPSIETTSTESNNPLYPILRIIGQLSQQQLIMLGAIILVFLIVLVKKIR